MDIYLAAPNTGSIEKHLQTLTNTMDVYLATTGTYEQGKRVNEFAHKLCVLESFFYVKDWMIPYIENKWDFILDSGAFTFFGKASNSVNWDEYVENYCDFINKHNVQKFFELDIDIIEGLDRVEKFRSRIVSLTGKQPIVVWRPSRGIDYWDYMVNEYPYIAISASGAYDSGWTRKRGSQHVLRQMVKKAQRNKTKVHGLGYTALKHLKYIGWDSVDSTAWIMGNMSGKIYNFTGTTINNTDIPRGTRLIAKKTAIHNFNEWVKFQHYAKYNL